MGPRATADQTAGEIFPFDLPSIDLTTGLPTGSQYDDRAIVLITASVVEQALETLLLAKFIPLSDDDERTLFSSDGGALSTFEAKVQLGFALGSYGRRVRIPG